MICWKNREINVERQVRGKKGEGRREKGETQKGERIENCQLGIVNIEFGKEQGKGGGK